MPRDPSIKSVLVIGSGPIVIGQACEFDYSGTQAIKVLKKEGLRVSLVNSNPATIMTDPEYADRTYVEPLTPEVVEAILERELGGERLDVGGVGDRLVGHDGGRVAVDQHDAVPERAQGLARLGAGVVELAGLADDDRPRSDNEDRFDVGAFGHQRVTVVCGRAERPGRAGCSGRGLQVKAAL